MAINFSLGVRMPKLNAQDMGATDYVSALSRGLSLGAQPRRQSEELLAQMLQNKLRGVQAQYADPMAQLGLQQKQAELDMVPYRQKLLEAQIARQNQMNEQPFGGNLTGVAREAYVLDQMREQLGEDHPAYMNAKRAYEAKISGQEGLNDYRKALGETANKRTSSALGKLEQEMAEVSAGFMPGSNNTIPLSPEHQNELLGQYALQKQKMTTDKSTRDRSLFASNIDKTIESINPESLVQFAGILGSIKKGIGKGKAPFGMESKEYRDYTKNLSRVKLLAHQVRQFYGDSIQPAMTQAIELMVNPATWENNPRIAMDNYRAIVDILEKETGTFRNALKSTREYEGKNPDQTVNTTGRYILAQAPDGTKRFISPEMIGKARNMGLTILD